MDIVEFCFENYNEIETEVNDIRGGINVEKVGGRSSTPSSPTEAVAFKNMTPVTSVRVAGQVIYNPERWLDIIDLTYENYRGTALYNLLQRRFNKKEMRQQICYDMHIGTTSYRIMLANALSFARGIATGFGLM